EEQRKEQEEAIARRFQSNTQVTDETEEGKKDYTDSPAIVRHHQKKSLVNQKSIKRRMTNKGLQESVVMAEILGKPRSMKPYKPGSSDYNISASLQCFCDDALFYFLQVSHVSDKIIG